MRNFNRLTYRHWRKHGESRFAPKLLCGVCNQPIRWRREAEHRECVKKQEAEQAAREATR